MFLSHHFWTDRETHENIEFLIKQYFTVSESKCTVLNVEKRRDSEVRSVKKSEEESKVRHFKGEWCHTPHTRNTPPNSQISCGGFERFRPPGVLERHSVAILWYYTPDAFLQGARKGESRPGFINQELLQV